MHQKMICVAVRLLCGPNIKKTTQVIADTKLNPVKLVQNLLIALKSSTHKRTHHQYNRVLAFHSSSLLDASALFFVQQRMLCEEILRRVFEAKDCQLQLSTY